MNSLGDYYQAQKRKAFLLSDDDLLKNYEVLENATLRDDSEASTKALLRKAAYARELERRTT